ncbi:vacuolar sorting protein [Calocera viscosa TUFC12733]|uniref:Vacuolar sorting protein n=1 Tax=Calocera viscosa (strain TUFC12733) TaxID=1330018 RepID=A0A167QJW3_CALVF|nr:vacuolar sorting protein [Calocera viscosa TUFC12733]
MADVSEGLSDDSFFIGKTKEYLELHEQVETSTNLLGELETFLSTFQTDLSAVSGQISDLQSRSKDFDAKLKGRRKIERPLSQLLADLAIPPELALLILDGNVSDAWIPGIEELEVKLDTIQQRTRVKAAKDLSEVAEGLRIVAATKIRLFFLSLMQPIRATVSTNMQIIQTSVLLKYRSLVGFLQRRAPKVATEVQRAYIGAARSYYETAFRRYSRSLGYIIARDPPKSQLITTSPSDPSKEEQGYDWSRLDYAQIEGPPVTLAYMADDKTYKQPVEALFRSLMLVLMDNATAEYNFINSFFNPAAAPVSMTGVPLMSPTFDDRRTDIGSVLEIPMSPTRTRPILSMEEQQAATNETKKALDLVWKQVMETALEYCKTVALSCWQPTPPEIIPLLTMMRLNENVLIEVQKRACSPFESFVVELRLSMWPIFQKEMNTQVESLKKLLEGASGGLLTKSTLKDSVVERVSRAYGTLFAAFISLSEPSEEAMLFSNLGRMRPEIAQIIITHGNKIKDSRQQAVYLSTAYENVLHSAMSGPFSNAHPKAQAEMAFWREKEENARKRIMLRSG